jgi:hypothetical protein
MNQTDNTRFAFIQSSWHRDIVGQGREAFLAEMARRGVPAGRIDVHTVPGAFEIPLHAKLLARSRGAPALLQRPLPREGQGGGDRLPRHGGGAGRAVGHTEGGLNAGRAAGFVLSGRPHVSRRTSQRLKAGKATQSASRTRSVAKTGRTPR